MISHTSICPQGGYGTSGPMSFLGVGYPGVGYLAWVGYPGAGYTLSPLGDEATTAVGTTHPTGMLSCFTIRAVEWINVR